ncbi:hypothetical protein PIB30_078996 [Stylosanthes scabra]|uniref:Uncharacterized protein n=1 Tax=Stylosanthes scabra TaxID=79078 RepID=A0ABU6TT81_9FABA|nr:hypothetical protein [Stylosanthes scabra]
MKAKDTTAAVMAGSTSSYAARAADTAAAVKCEETTAARAGSTETPNMAGNGQGEAAEGGSACKPHHRWDGKPHNRVRSDPSSAPRTRTTRCDPDLDPEPPPYSMNRARSISAPEKKSRSASCVTGPSTPGSWSRPPPECPPVERTPPPRPHRPRLTADPPAHCWMLPHPSTGYRGAASAPVVRGLGHRAEARSDLSPETQQGAHHPQLKSPGILQQAILGQEPLATGNRPPVSVFPTGPTWVPGGHDLNLMISGHPIALEAVPVHKLIGPPSVVAPGRGAEEPVQVHRGHGDGLLTAKLSLHSIGVMKPDVHEKNNRHRRKPCLDLARLVQPGRLDGAPWRCHVRGPRTETTTQIKVTLTHDSN